MGYCDVSDLYKYGLPRGGLPNPGRLIAVNTTTNVITLDGHGFVDDDAVVVRADTMPSPLVDGTTYYAIVLGQSTFKLASSAGGSAIDLTTQGLNVFVVIDLSIDDAIEAASAIVDDMLIAHVVPITGDVPVLVKMVTAHLAIGMLRVATGQGSPSLMELVDQAQRTVASWRKGIAVRGTNAPSAANLAVVGTLDTARAWDSGDGRIP